MEKFTKSVGILAAAAAFVGIGNSAKADDLLYDWRAVNAATTPVPGFVPAPFVSTGNAASAVPVLIQTQGFFPGKVAIKAVSGTPNPTATPLTPADLGVLFGPAAPFQINYVFQDYEGATGQAVATAQAAAIRLQPKGTVPFIGNFRMFPGSGDTSGPGAGPSVSDYLGSGMNMANEDLYPGSPSYKNAGQLPGGTSTSPNIRSALFVLPIERASFVTANLPLGHKHIPYVNRFNNWGNNALDSDGNPANGYRFTNPTGTQMLSRGDFSALVAHYRLRGADGVHLLDGGVEGYTQAQFEQDAQAGFKLPAIDAIFAGGGARVATLDTLSRVGDLGGGNASLKDNESTGVVYSGVYSLSQGGTDPLTGKPAGKLALLVSNLDEIGHGLTIQQKIGGHNIVGNIDILAGQHKLLEFTGAGTQWQLTNTSIVFTDADRSGVGVPEPVAMGGASIFALTMLFRRRRSR